MSYVFLLILLVGQQVNYSKGIFVSKTLCKITKLNLIDNLLMHTKKKIN